MTHQNPPPRTLLSALLLTVETTSRTLEHHLSTIESDPDDIPDITVQHLDSTLLQLETLQNHLLNLLGHPLSTLPEDRWTRPQTLLYFTQNLLSALPNDARDLTPLSPDQPTTQDPPEAKPTPPKTDPKPEPTQDTQQTHHPTEPTPEDDPKPNPPPVDLEALQKHMQARSFENPTDPPKTSQDSTDTWALNELRSDLQRLCIQPEHLHGIELRNHVLRLSNKHTIRRWTLLDSKPITHAVLSACAALIRHAQEHDPSSDTQTFYAAVGILKDTVTSTWCGLVHGLALAHTPLRGSWLADFYTQLHLLPPLLKTYTGPLDLESYPALKPATSFDLEHFLDRDTPISDLQFAQHIDLLLARNLPTNTRVLRLLDAYIERLEPLSTLKNLRQDIRTLAKHDAEDDIDSPDNPSWDWFDSIQGRRAYIVGGALRADVRENLKYTLSLEYVEWINGKQRRKIQSLADKINESFNDIIFILNGYSSHAATGLLNTAAKANPDHNGFIVQIPQGYGINTLIHHLDQTIQNATEHAPQDDAQ